MPQLPHSLRKVLPGAGEREPIQALRLLCWLRVIAIASQSCVIAFVHYGLGIALPLAPLAFTLAALAVWNLLVSMRIRRNTGVRHAEVALNLAVDALAFTSVIYFTGGAENPFVSLYLLPISLAAASLPAAYAWLVGATCAAGYTLLLIRNVPLPSVDHRFGGDFDLHVAGMWVNFLVAAVLIVFFVGRIARLLRQRDQELARMREEALRDEQLVELGTLAAGTAHDLNTPLSTLALLVEEIGETLPDSAAEPCLDAMNEQIETISRRLEKLASDVGADRSERARCTSLTGFVDELMRRWRESHPGIQISTRFDTPAPDVDIVAEATIERAIRNVLDNAAQAAAESRGAVDVAIRCRGDRLVIVVRDDGPGLAAAVAHDVGARIVSTKRRGLGIGLLLSRACLERFGGCLEIKNRAAGGVEASIELPLDGLLAHG
jgi:two-component system sensor histidine kinase RegB